MVPNAKDELVCLDDVFECIATPECRGGKASANRCMQAASDRNIQAVSAVRSGGFEQTVEAKVLRSDPFSVQKNVVDPFNAELVCLDDVSESITTPECRGDEASANRRMQAASDQDIPEVSAASTGGHGHCWTWPTAVEPEILWMDAEAVPKNMVDPFYADWPHW